MIKIIRSSLRLLLEQTIYSPPKGQILVLSLVVLTLVMINTILIISSSVTYNQNSRYSIDELQALNLAEAGIDKAVASLNSSGGAYSGEEDVELGEGTYTVSISSKDAATKVIKSTGYIPNSTNPKVTRTIEITAAIGVGASFVYGIQVGEGGLELGNSNKVIGSVYSNGNVSAGNSNEITGDVYVAGGTQPQANQEHDCENPNCQDLIFGKKVGNDNILDVAQSFKPSATSTLNKISLKVKKVGNPTDVTLRILTDANGKPDKNGVLTSGTLYSSLVSANYGWIDVTFSTSPTINADATYWLMVDTSLDNSNYWSFQSDTLQGYTNGSPKWADNWQTGNPSWNNITADLSFQIFMGGSPTSIRASNNFTIDGSAHANTLENLTIKKDAYYQAIINSNVTGVLYPNSQDPPPKSFPLSEANILDWKQEAETNGVVTGGISSCVSLLDSKKIVGNVTFGSNCNVTVKSPAWITGNLTLGSNNELKLDPVFGVSSGLIIVDGTVSVGSNNDLVGSGEDGSILMVLTTYDSITSGVPAISVNSQGNSGVLYAGNGIIEPGTNNNFRELTAWGIRLIHNSTITYDVGLSSVLFSSGPSGSYSIVRGTYQSK